MRPLCPLDAAEAAALCWTVKAGMAKQAGHSTPQVQRPALQSISAFVVF